MKFLILIILEFFLVQVSVSSRILFVFPTHSKSHVIIAEGLAKTLASRGHDVTIVSNFSKNRTSENLREIAVPLKGEFTMIANAILKNPGSSMRWLFFKLISTVTEIGEGLLNLPVFKKILDEEKFDLVITGVFMNNYLLGLGDHFKCPTIILNYVAPFQQSNLLVGNPTSYSSVPHMMMDSFDLSFKNRVKNFVFHNVELSMYYYTYFVQRSIYK